MPRELQPCGTPAAYARHMRVPEPACDACRYAHNRHQKARNRAMVRLAQRYRTAFAALLDEELAKEKDYTS